MFRARESHVPVVILSNVCAFFRARAQLLPLAAARASRRFGARPRDAFAMDLTLENSVGRFASRGLTPADAAPALLRNVLLPPNSPGGAYRRCDVLIADGKLARIADAGSVPLDQCPSGTAELACDERMLMPGLVNGHTHSVEHWARGLIKPLPLELWVLQLIRHEPRGERGWAGADSWVKTPAAAVAVSAMHCGVESLLSGTTAVMDHLLCRDLADVEAAVAAYRALGVRAFIAPMLGDDLEGYSNYIPLARDAKGRNDAAGPGCDCGAMCAGGKFRTRKGARDPAKTEANLKLWRDAAAKFHDPANGINIVVGPVTAYSASTELLRGAAEIRREFGLLGHVHLLETRAQALMAKQFFPEHGSAVKHLIDTGFLQVPGTSCGHCVWLTPEEQALMAAHGATAVHNPWSNLRLGSGVAALGEYASAGVNVCLGADGACSSDGQDMLEVCKLANVLPCVATPEYRDWPTAHHTFMRLGAENGYAGLLMSGAEGQVGRGGVLEEGAVADVSLWDLTALSMLPRTDPVSLLVQGSRVQAKSAGSGIDSVWVRGVRVVAGGEPVGVDLAKLRETLRAAQGAYRDQADTDSSTDAKCKAAEVEYRAAMGLDDANAAGERATYEWPDRRVLYDATSK